ncbi:MAG: PQQ-dependent sugar dehydrogenase [Flavobacteriales bacterium]|nr:PQQ-dependent sugar dehydrogenase [Flavobacteriales bacterium]
MPSLRGGAPRLEDVRLPPGFAIQMYADSVENARAMCWGDRGTLFVGSRDAGIVHALRDTDGDGTPDRRWTIARGLRMPAGVAFRQGALYVSAIDRILRFDAIEDHLDDPPVPVVVTDDLPQETHHGWKFIAFGPDDRLYVPVGAPCNICESEDPIYASITRIRPDGDGREIVARGVRNTVGFDWSPEDSTLWFTDNGRDWAGDDRPNDELDHLTAVGEHFGYPYCHEGTWPDPEFGKGHDCMDYTAPAARLGPHVAALGMRFYRGTSFPEKYHHAIFIAEHGSWNRSTPIGYRIAVAFPRPDGTAETEVFAEGWLRGNRAWGRPVDVLNTPEGDLLVSDDAAGAIYRISFTR